MELLACYTLFRWPVTRNTILNLDKPGFYIEAKNKMIGNIEKEGLLFLEPIQNSADFYCIIPFLTLYWLIKNSQQTVSIPLLDNISNYYSSENCSLHIMMSKLWGLTKKNNLQTNSDGLFSVQLSNIVALHSNQEDIEIFFKPIFRIMSALKRIEVNNDYFKQCFENNKCIAFLNARGASCVDSIIFSNPIIGIQEKQSVNAKMKIINGEISESFNLINFEIERNKFIKDGIFILIADANQGDFEIGPRDVFIGSNDFASYAGPLIALRKLFAVNTLNEVDKLPKRMRKEND